ncbi:hypothetical protein AGMMS49587_16170 [Spirochaetia bacterium]|nr:hypothetical protein AGMMS49587_16170 [Spirochaetia bacterium]
MNTERLFYKIIPALMVTLLLGISLLMFGVKYLGPGTDILLLYGNSINREFFYLNFIIPFIICGASVYACLFFPPGGRQGRNIFGYLKNFCLVTGFSSAVFCGFFLEDLYLIKLCLYTAFIVMASVAFGPPKNYWLDLWAIVLFILFLFHPTLLRGIPVEVNFVNPSFTETIPAAVYLLSSAASLCLFRYFLDKNIYDNHTINHLNAVSEKMILFNHHLQELVKYRGEEAVRQDRLRFTRDLHDSCGYAFTNIILVTDAAVSCGPTEPVKSQEVLQRIRNLAATGLKDTRETLHLIRNIQEPYTKSIETVVQLKAIFEEVTGIPVTIEWGNMKNDYGSTINYVLTRIIQEAFTNSIRHGKATGISIQFWEFQGKLSMSVTDNGVGTSLIVKGIGLAGMEERLESIGGNLEVSLPPEGGFRLAITIPIVSI